MGKEILDQDNLMESISLLGTETCTSYLVYRLCLGNRKHTIEGESNAEGSLQHDFEH